MSKIDFAKVEERISQAIQTIFIKKVLNGRALLSARALDFYNLNDGPRPKPRDTLDTVFEEDIDANKENNDKKGDNQETTTIEDIDEDSERIALQNESLDHQSEILTTDKENIQFPDTFYIQKHLEWFQKKKYKSFYKSLGSSEKEIENLLKKENLSESESKQAKEMLLKMSQLKEDILKKEDLTSDQKIIDKGRKNHKTKRFNTREKWIPL